MFLMKLVKYKILLLSQPKKITKQSTKKYMIDDTEKPTKMSKFL